LRGAAAWAGARSATAVALPVVFIVGAVIVAVSL
jgi:hypothetical protein